MQTYIVLEKTGIESALEICLQALDKDGIVCVPTETVYGLICSEKSKEAVQRLVRLKRRPKDKPFALFTPSWSSLARAPIRSCSVAQKLAERFWPGPLTLVIPAEKDCPCEYNGRVGVRSPDGEFIRALLARRELLLVNTSLNRSGEAPVWRIDPEMEILREVDVAVDQGRLPERSPSTVVDCTVVPPRVLRHGEITEEEIRETVK